MNLIEYFKGGEGLFFAPFVNVDRGGGVMYIECPSLSTRGGGGQNWVQIGPSSCLK